MRKSIVVLLLLIQLLLLFIFENVYSIFKELERKEIVAIKEKSHLMAELLIKRFEGRLPEIKDRDYFDNIFFRPGLEPRAAVEKVEGIEFYILVKSPSEKKEESMLFEKKITSSSLISIRKLSSIFMGLIIVIGIFLVFTGFYLVYIFKKSKNDVKLKSISPLQNYLLELKDSEKELKNIVEMQQINVLKKEELNKNIINTINAAIIFLNNARRVEIFNAAAEKMFSQSFANARNNEIKRVLVKFPGIARFLQAHENQKISSEVASGSRVFRIDLLPLGEIGELIMIMDITEEKMREEIEQKNKNFMMLGEMTAFLTHEVRNSLGVIFGYTRTIKSEGKKIQRVNKEIRFLTAMLESFLNFSKPVKIEKQETLEITGLLNKICREKKMKLECPRGKIFLETDPALLNSVLANLVLNSREAGADTIEVQFKENDQLEIIVKDNGSGIDEDIREKVWLPFFTTKEKGTGMGLAIIRKIVNSLKGDITILESGPGSTTFKIVFYEP